MKRNFKYLLAAVLLVSIPAQAKDLVQLVIQNPAKPAQQIAVENDLNKDEEQEVVVIKMAIENGGGCRPGSICP